MQGAESEPVGAAASHWRRAGATSVGSGDCNMPSALLPRRVGPDPRRPQDCPAATDVARVTNCFLQRRRLPCFAAAGAFQDRVPARPAAGLARGPMGPGPREEHA